MGHLALVVDQRGAELEAGTHDTVVLRHPDGSRERIGMRALGSVVVHGDVKLSTGLLQSLAAHGVALTMLPLRGRAAAVGFTQLPLRHACLRHEQHLWYADADRRLALARLVVTAKIDAMAAFQREHAPSDPDAATLALFAVSEARDIAALMGVEGASTQRHFEQLRRAYAKEGPFSFCGRSRQPPEDPANALMSLAYALAHSLAVQLGLRAGLDVQLGFLHGLQRDRHSLGLDLLEAARAALDDWVLGLLNRRRSLDPAMFAGSRDEPVRLTQEGRALFYPLWFREGHLIALRPMRALLGRLLGALRAGRSLRETPV
jgi:CRISPR-associated protein Cas1